MAKVTYEDPIHHLSGKISKNYRTTYCFQRATGTKYTQVHGERTKPASEDELALREKFAAVAKRTRQRMQDPAQMMQDAAAFSKQTKYPTLYGYVFSQEWNA